MKNKGIPIWEMYFEYIVLGVAGLLLVGFTVWQFLLASNTANVTGMRETVTPGNVDRLLVTEADRIGSFIAPTAPLPFEIPDPDRVSDSFASGIHASVSPQSNLPLADYRIALMPTSDEPSGVPFVEPSIPAPHTVLAQQYYDTLTEAVWQSHTDLQARWPTEPYDITWITAAAKIDVGQILRNFRTPGPNGEAAIPEIWYRENPNIVDVVVEREEFIDGRWANRRKLDLLPGAIAQALREQMSAGDITVPVRDAILEQLGDAALQRSVIQPEFYDTLNGSWAPPREDDEQLAQGLAEEQRRIFSLERQLVIRQSERDRLAQRLEEIGGPLRDPAGDGRSGRSGSGTPGGAGGGGTGQGPAGPGSGSARGPGAPTGQDAGNERQRRMMTAQLDSRDAQIARLRDQLIALRGHAEVAAAEVVQGLFETDVWDLWGHDIDVEPGSTYRYRFIVQVYNPFFARRLNLIEDQHSLADSFTIRSQASEWSEPILATPPMRYFLTAATPGDTSGARLIGRLGLGQAMVEVYRFYNGRWWRERFSVQPGERIGEPRTPREAGRALTTQPIDFSTEWYVLDIVSDMDSSTQDRDRGRGASVLLERIDGGEVVEWRSPQDDVRSMERDQLDALVESARVAMAAGN